jgi:hypothetical protein
VGLNVPLVIVASLKRAAWDARFKDAAAMAADTADTSVMTAELAGSATAPDAWPLDSAVAAADRLHTMALTWAMER